MAPSALLVVLIELHRRLRSTVSTTGHSSVRPGSCHDVFADGEAGTRKGRADSQASQLFLHVVSDAGYDQGIGT